MRVSPLPPVKWVGPPDDGKGRCAQRLRQTLLARSEHRSPNSLEGLFEWHSLDRLPEIVTGTGFNMLQQVDCKMFVGVQSW